MEKVGFIGLGIMGLPMASNLLKAGYELVVCDMNAERIAMLPPSHKITVANTPKEVAAKTRLVILMLPNSPHVEQLIEGEDGLRSHLAGGSLIIDMSSISPILTKKLASALASDGIDFLDAPVSGGQKGAVEGTLTIMVGGKKEIFEKVFPLLSVMGKRIIHCGDNGAGQTVKVVNQLMSAVNLIGMSEAFTMGVKGGVDPQIMHEVILNGSGRCWALEDRMPNILKGEFAPGFTIDLHAKDIKLALEMSNELHTPIYVSSVVYELFKTAQVTGKGKLDNSAIITLYENLAGVEVRKA